MNEFNPSPYDRIVIGGQTYQVMPHPSVPAFAFGQEGRKALVYQIANTADGSLYALKEFKEAFRVPELVDVCDALARFSSWRGLEVCARQCLHAGQHDDALANYPDLEFAVLMPWITGSTWYDIVVGEKPLGRLDALTFANATAEVLSALEESSLAHCDIAAPNVIINPNTGHTHLIDVEDLYAPGFASPSALPAGTAGYAHKVASEGLWSPTADRFAGAILLAEMATWHDPAIRKASDEEHFFGPAEMQLDSPRYQLMLATLSGMDTRLAELLDMAWRSETLDDCPRLSDWRNVIYDVFRREQISKVVADWQPIAVPGGMPETKPQEVEPLQPAVPEPHPPAPVVDDEPVAEPTPAPAPSPAPAPIEPAMDRLDAPTARPTLPSRPIAMPSTQGQPAPAAPQTRQIAPPPAGGPVKEWRPLVAPSTSPAAPNGSAGVPIAPQPNRPIPIAMPDVDDEVTAEPPPEPVVAAPDEAEPAAKVDEPPAGMLLKPVLDLSHVDKRNRPHLVWSESPDATHYLLQESDTPEFDSPKEFKLKADDTRWNPVWGRSGRLFYRVRARSGDEDGPWSEVLSLRIA